MKHVCPSAVGNRKVDQMALVWEYATADVVGGELAAVVAAAAAEILRWDQ